MLLSVLLLAVGLAIYPWILRDFDVRQLLSGPGDHWIVGGALAISALAGGEIVAAIDVTGALPGLRPWAVGASLVALAAALAWVPPLLIGELRRPRLRFRAARWGTVFPVGMYATALLTLGATEDVGVLTDVGRVWVWVGVAVWVAVAIPTARACVRTLAGSWVPRPRS